MGYNINRTFWISVVIIFIAILFAGGISLVLLAYKEGLIFSATQAPAQAPESAVTDAGEGGPNNPTPVNALPTTGEIEENVRMRNERQRVIDDMIAQRQNDALRARMEIDAAQGEPSRTAEVNNSVSSASETSETPAEVDEKIQSQTYLVH